METSQSIAASKATLSPDAQILFDELKAIGYKTLISKKHYAEIVGCSLSSIDNYMRDGINLPDYKKLGTAKNAKVLFSLRDVAQYLSSLTVKMA